MGDYLPEVDLGTNFKVIQIALGKFHNCALSSENDVKCFGYNAYGGCGYGHTNNIGGGPNEMGDNLPIVDLGTGFIVNSIAPNAQRTCAISQSNTLKCFGNNDNGQLGLGDTENRGDDANEMGDYLPEVDLGTNFKVIQIALGKFHNCALSSENDVKCFGYNAYGGCGYGHTNNIGGGPNEMGDNLP
eukprot:246093_1